MTAVLAAVAVSCAVVVATWVALAVAARRLPAGRGRDLVSAVPAAAGALRRVARHPDVPRRVKVVVALALLWVLSPVDLVPDVLPVVGVLDDVVVVALALRWAARRVPPGILGDTGRNQPLLPGHLPECNTCGDGSATPPTG